MKEFFRGWRRKFGVVTLMVACFMAASWMRSIGYWEDLSMPWGNGNRYLLHAGVCNGKVYYCRTEFHPPNFVFGATILFRRKPPSWYSNPASWYFRGAVPFNTDISETIDDHNWYCRSGLSLPGPDVLREPPVENLIWAIPHWLVIFPLIVLSVVLLLKKPKSSTQKKNAQPTANE